MLHACHRYIYQVLYIWCQRAIYIDNYILKDQTMRRRSNDTLVHQQIYMVAPFHQNITVCIQEEILLTCLISYLYSISFYLNICLKVISGYITFKYCRLYFQIMLKQFMNFAIIYIYNFAYI